MARPAACKARWAGQKPTRVCRRGIQRVSAPRPALSASRPVRMTRRRSGGLSGAIACKPSQWASRVAVWSPASGNSSGGSVSGGRSVRSSSRCQFWRNAMTGAWQACNSWAPAAPNGRPPSSVRRVAAACQCRPVSASGTSRTASSRRDLSWCVASGSSANGSSSASSSSSPKRTFSRPCRKVAAGWRRKRASVTASVRPSQSGSGRGSAAVGSAGGSVASWMARQSLS